jgi:hypothetical protein
LGGILGGHAIYNPKQTLIQVERAQAVERQGKKSIYRNGMIRSDHSSCHWHVHQPAP